MNKKGKIVDINRKAADLLGYEISEIEGSSIFEFMPLDAISKMRVIKNFALRMVGKEVEPYELTFISKEGKKLTGIVRAKALKNGEGDITGNLAVISDITGLKNYEEELILAKDKAERSDRMKTEFLAQMSHEIRTPINTILSFASLIEDNVSEYLDEDLKSSFNLMNSAGNRIIRTIDLILNMSDLVTGNYEYKPRKINLDNGVLSRVKEQFKPLAAEKNLEFSVNLETDDTFIYADEHSIYNIVESLVDNAIKYTQSGSVIINLSRSENNNFVMEVIDTGVGIAQEYLPSLFKPFSQEQQGYTRKYEGNGLGLALVKGYCDLNNAEISVQSEKNKGTTFTIVFD
jgi:PAS domain S-box-containing protein